MESSTMTRQGGDGRPNLEGGSLQANRETGMANRTQGTTRKLAYLTSQHWRPAQEKRKKGQIFGGTKPIGCLE